jgi:hypothetical protein
MNCDACSIEMLWPHVASQVGSHFAQQSICARGKRRHLVRREQAVDHHILI